MTRKKELEKLARQIKKCKKCKYKNARLVFGEGPVNAKIMFIGEAPGKEEDKLGRPFVGRAGKKLNELLKSSGIERKNCYITSVVKYRPPKNRTPTSVEIKANLPYLKKQIALIKPKIIVLLGDVAVRALLGKIKLSEIRGKRFLVDSIIYLPTYHPAAARFPKVKRAMQSDFAKLKK